MVLRHFFHRYAHLHCQYRHRIYCSNEYEYLDRFGRKGDSHAKEREKDLRAAFNEDVVTVSDDAEKECNLEKGIDQDRSESPILSVKRAQIVIYNVACF